MISLKVILFDIAGHLQFMIVIQRLAFQRPDQRVYDVWLLQKYITCTDQITVPPESASEKSAVDASGTTFFESPADSGRLLKFPCSDSDRVCRISPPDSS